MNNLDQHSHVRHREGRTTIGEILLAAVVFASMGAITWAIRGTSGWSGIDGTIVPGMTWGIFWWYICWRKGIDARWVPLWLGLGIALGGELGYGQYVSWIRGTFNVGDEVVPIAPWVGYAWFAVCGIAWGAPGGIALGWALGGRKPLGAWLARLVIPVGAALLARIAIQAWPWLPFPHFDLGIYVAKSESVIDLATNANTQRNMIIAWIASAVAGAIAWYATTKTSRPNWATRGISVLAVAAMIVILLRVAEWLFFPEDQLGLCTGELGNHLGRTVYTNSQNAIVVGWWIGAVLVAIIQQDRHTQVAGLVIGVGFGIGFPLSAIWCLGYTHAPELVDWWKIWELNSGFYLGLLYAAVLYWSIGRGSENRESSRDNGLSIFGQWCETISLALGVFLVVYVMAREEFFSVGIILGLVYVVALFFATLSANHTIDRRRGISFVYSAFLLIFVMAWGASSQTGIVLGLYDAEAVDQYAWPWARVAIFAPTGILIGAVVVRQMWLVLRNPHATLPGSTEVRRIDARIVDLMAFTGVVGAVSIWPAKIGVLYALLLGLSLFAFNRLSRRLGD